MSARGQDAISLQEARHLSLLDLPDELLEITMGYLSYAETIAFTWTNRRNYWAFGSRKPRIRLNDKGQPVMLWGGIDKEPPADMYEELLAMETWPAYQSANRLTNTKGVDDVELQIGTQLTEADKIRRCWKDLYACSTCVKLKPASSFSAAMLAKTKRKMEHDKSDTSMKPSRQVKRRYCIQCGVKSLRYQPGIVLGLGIDFPFDHEHRHGAKEEIGLICKRCKKLKLVSIYGREMSYKTCKACLEYRPPGSR